MAQAASFVEEGIDRLQTTVRRFDREIRRFQRQLERRVRKLGRQIRTQRKETERRARRELERLQARIRRTPIVRQASSARAEAARQLENVLETLPIATRSEVRRLDRKISQLNRKLRALEKATKTAASAQGETSGAS